MIEIKNVSKSYKNYKVLEDINFYIKQGEIVGLLGPNGAGKTTAFNIVAGFIKQDKGFVYIDEKDVSSLPPYKRANLGLSFLPQEHSLFDEISVYDNIYMFTDIVYKEKNQKKTMAEDILKSFELYEHKDKKARELSGGMKRKLEIARTLIKKPKYLMLDEPFAGIDPVVISEIKELIRSLAEKDIGILMTDHNVFETLKIIDRGYIISRGHIIASGSPKELLNNDEVRRVYLGYDIKL